MPLLTRVRRAINLNLWLNDPWRLFSVTATFSLAVPGSAALKALLLFSLWGWLVVRQKHLRVHSLLWFSSVLAATTFATCIGIYMNFLPNFVENQALRILTMFVIISVGLLLVDRKEVTTDRIDWLIFVIAVIAAVLKAVIIFFLVTGAATSQQIQARLGFETVQDQIGFGLLRLQFPSDIFLQFMVVCYVGGRSRLRDTLVLLAISVGVLLSFSRYIFAAYVLSLLLRSVLLRRLDFVSRVAGVIAAAAVILFLGSLVARFAGSSADASDAVRSAQIWHLTDAIVERPLLGSGMGASVHNYARSESLPFSYEVQWYALTMQFGLIGLAWFLFNMLAPLLLVFQSTLQRLFFLVVWAMWAASGFTNPYIVSLGSGFGLALLTIRLTRTVPRLTRKSFLPGHPVLAHGV